MQKAQEIECQNCSDRRKIIKNLIDAVAEIDNEMTNWISVKDRLPEDENSYLVSVKCSDGETITILYYTKENKFIHIPVTHWMPLPEPPK